MGLTAKMEECLAWLADDDQQFGMPGGRRTMQALVDRGLAEKVDGRWVITDVGRITLGPVALTSANQFVNL